MAILKILLKKKKKKKKKNPLGGLKIKILHIRMVCTWENGKIKKEKLLIRLGWIQASIKIISPL